MRSTRDLLRRRLHLVRKRGQLLAHILNTNSQCNLPEFGGRINYKANRTGVAERFEDPCVRKSIEVDLGLIAHYDELVRDLDLHIVRAVKSDDADTFYRLQSIPGSLRLRATGGALSLDERGPYDRRSERPSLGVTCLDCRANGHTNGATHLVGDIRPQHFRRRIDTPALRGVNVQRLFGSQRALRTVEDFTEFEQRAAYFDGDPVAASKKGLNILERGSQVHNMAEFQELLDFPPAPKLDVFGMLDPALATPEERRGQEVFFGKGKCGVCHPAPHYTDGTMHDLKVARFFTPRMINGRVADREGPIKTFPLRGIKDSPPYLHDGRLLTLDDTVEFFNLVLQTRLTAEEKKALVAFMRAL